MEKIVIIGLMILSGFIFGQQSGNLNYNQTIKYLEKNIDTSYPKDLDIYAEVKGMANIKADSYVAIFNVRQIGKTAKEVTELINERINSALTKLKQEAGVTVFVDMVSFVPKYQYDVEKKIFSKRTYTEIPSGFELTKNLHIKYKNPKSLDKIIEMLSYLEIYDLVRVDYFSSKMEQVKKQLMEKSKIILQNKLVNYQTIVSEDLKNARKKVLDSYKVVLPTECYQSYTAYNSSLGKIKRKSVVYQAGKSATLYYQPILNKEFDFVINPVILEPVIQIMYNIKLVAERPKKVLEKELKKYILVTPNGELKTINLTK